MEKKLTCLVCNRKEYAIVIWYLVPNTGIQIPIASVGGFFVGREKVEGWVCSSECLQAHSNLGGVDAMIRGDSETVVISPINRRLLGLAIRRNT